MILSVLTAFAVMGCGTRKAEQFQALPFPDVLPPELLDNPLDRAEYMAEHMWDRFTAPENVYPSDSLLVNGVAKGDVEQKFANWANILSYSRHDVAVRAVVRLYERAVACERRDSTSNIFETFEMLVEKYLYDPNSPLRNEDLYGPYADCLSRSEYVEAGRRQAYSYDAAMCALNRVGTKAADFRFEDKDGKVRSLYGVDADFILLFFSNPGCDACMEIITSLRDNPRIAAMVSSGVIAVLNIYIDEDIAAWRSYMPIYPDEWYNGFDPDSVIRTDVLYNVRAIPSLYLLDREKRVIMKDAVTERCLDFFVKLDK